MMTSKLSFSLHPGRRERHLQRRFHYGRLFDASAAAVSDQEIQAARQEDQEEELTFLQSLQKVLQLVAQLAGHEQTETILDIKEQLDRLYEQCAGLRGVHEREKQGILQLQEVIMNAIRNAAGQDPLAMQELDREQAARKLHLELLEYPIIADLLYPESAITEEELVPAILCEGEETIRVVMSLFNEEQREEIVDRAQHLVKKLDHGDELHAEMESRIRALRAPVQ